MTPDTTQTALVDTALSSLFEISASDWTEISKRVGIVCLAQGIESELEPYLPGFSALADACATWRDATFPQLVGQAQQLAAYSHTAQVTFGDLQSALDAADLDPSAPLPPVLQVQAQGALLSVTAATKQLAFDFTVLSGDLTAFTRVNQAADAAINAYEQRLGGDWTSLLGETQSLETAVEQVLGAWSALTADLVAVAPDQVQLTMEVLAGLGIDAALLAWQDLEQDAIAFPAMAADQQVYLSGQWIEAQA